MASKETNNCPTSDRDGACVSLTVNRQAIAEIERSNGHVFMPDSADVVARQKREAENDCMDLDAFDDIDLDTDEGWEKLENALPDVIDMDELDD